MRGILLVWDFGDLSWECLAWKVLSSKHAKIRGILLLWVSLDIDLECLGRQVF